MSDERVRLFVALELPERVRAALMSWAESALHAVPGMRAVAAESVHVTLCFLGWRAAAEIEPIASACGSVRGSPVARLSLGEALWLPSRRPRVLAVGLDETGEALSTVQSTLADALQAGGWYVPESRPFLVHVTLARAGKRVRVRPAALPPVPSLRFDAARITLYRSRLKPGGAVYEPLASVSLGY